MANIISSGLVTTTAAAIYAGSGKLHSVDVIADGSNAVNAAILDGEGGTELCKARLKTSVNPESIHIDCSGVQFAIGLWLVISGTNGAVIARYEPI